MLRKNAGFTLVEVVVAIGLIGIVVISISTLFTTIQSTQQRTARMESATRAAQRQMESLRNNNYTNLTAGSNIDFTSQLPPNLKNANGTVAISEPNDGLKRIDITVTYKDGTTQQKVSLSSLVGILGITQ